MRCLAFAAYHSYNSFGSSSNRRFKDLIDVCCPWLNSTYVVLVFIFPCGLHEQPRSDQFWLSVKSELP
jgi:hypothetical protein